jgi:hypothetical protein
MPSPGYRFVGLSVNYPMETALIGLSEEHEIQLQPEFLEALISRAGAVPRGPSVESYVTPLSATAEIRARSCLSAGVLGRRNPAK